MIYAPAIERLSLGEDFWNLVKKTATCWLWSGRVDKDGYGRIFLNGKMVRAHRAAFAAMVSNIPQGMLVCHHCDHPGCVNPTHLFLGSPKDNMEDRDRKGRYVNARALQTHCKRGHEFTPENTRMEQGRRRCRQCVTYRRRNRSAAE